MRARNALTGTVLAYATAMVSIETLKMWELQRQRAQDAEKARLVIEHLAAMAKAIAVLRVT